MEEIIVDKIKEVYNRTKSYRKTAILCNTSHTTVYRIIKNKQNISLREQLKRKEKECEELKQVIRNIKDIIANRIDYENFIGNIIDELKEVEE